MVETLLDYRTLLFAGDGRAYRARACGCEARDGTRRWHGWIEFSPLEDRPPIRSAPETTQPNRTCTLYWSAGLTPVYLEGALERALRLAGIRSATRASASVATATSHGRRGLTPHASGISPATTAIAAAPRLKLSQFDRRFLRSLVIAPG